MVKTSLLRISAARFHHSCHPHAFLVRAYTARAPVKRRTLGQALGPLDIPGPAFYGPDADIWPFLDAWRPSDGHEYCPWYRAFPEHREVDDLAHEHREAEVKARAGPLWEALKVECRRIKREAPTRSNKKLGTRSQKQLREEAHLNFNQEIASLCKELEYTGGRWVCSINPAKVDEAWRAVATAVATRGGALFGSACKQAQVAARASAPMRHFESTWSLVLECDDSYNPASVGHVARTLVKLGVQPGYFKTDVFSLLRILAKNEAQLEPMLYKGKDFVAPDATGPTWTRRNARVAVPGGFV